MRSHYNPLWAGVFLTVIEYMSESRYGLGGVTAVVDPCPDDPAVEVVAPEVAENADRRALERIEAEQERDRYLTWSKDADTGHLRALLIRLDSNGKHEFGAPVGLGAPPGRRRWRLHHRYAS